MGPLSPFRAAHTSARHRLDGTGPRETVAWHSRCRVPRSTTALTFTAVCSMAPCPRETCHVTCKGAHPRGVRPPAWASPRAFVRVILNGNGERTSGGMPGHASGQDESRVQCRCIPCPCKTYSHAVAVRAHGHVPYGNQRAEQSNLGSL
eukprot:948630-Prymnesium_polylepis.2